ncbi:hypothetical protein K402DRAFT_314020, partial [Aulographum hederae CBS 113979]
LRVLTTPTADTPGTALALQFANKSYLVGQVGEGSQRAFVQDGARMIKFDDVFLTGKSQWGNTGGLFGFLLTIADSFESRMAEAVKHKVAAAEARQRRDPKNSLPSTKPEPFIRRCVNIFGPPNINHTLATARRFIFRRNTPVNAQEFYADEPAKCARDGTRLPTWADDNIKVWAMPIVPESSSGYATSHNPRKRSFDVANDEEKGAGRLEADTERQQRDRNDQKRKGIVTEMFDSTWRLDNLVETPLHQVHMPATIFHRDTNSGTIERWTGPVPGGSERVPDMTVLVRKPWPGALVTELPPVSTAPEALSYIIRLHDIRGKFSIQAAEEHGVQNFQRTMLAAGQSIVNDRGETVTPDMVLGPARKGAGFAVVDLPGQDYVQPLLDRKEWQSEIMDGVVAICWILAPGVVGNAALRSFIAETPHLQHIISSSDVCANRLTMDNAASSAIRLSQVDFSRFPVPHFDNKTLPQQSHLADSSNSTEELSSHLSLPTGANVRSAERGLSLTLRPKVDVSTKGVIPFLSVVDVLLSSSRQVKELAEQAQREAKEDNSIAEWRESIPGSDVEIITLGTGSSLPSKYRNVSATLVRVPGFGNYLLDCGEGTLGQLKRVFAPSELKDVLKDLRMIWISHLHADHHLGTASVIKAWYETVHTRQKLEPLSSFTTEDDLKRGILDAGAPRRLAVVSGVHMLEWLAEHSQIEDIGYSHILPFMPASKGLLLHHRAVHESLGARSLYFPPYTLPNINLENLEAVHVSHCHDARAVALTFANGFKVSYSGDCRPSPKLAAIGKDSTVLIHEATFDDDMQGDARAKKHSTTGEALKVGMAMRARTVVLTHFSQRYAKLPNMESVDLDRFDLAEEAEAEEKEGDDVPVGLAEDPDASAALPEGLTDDLPPLPTPTMDPSARSTASEPPSNQSAAPVPVPRPNPSSRRIGDMRICVAFDYMRVRVGDIPIMEKYTPALLELFKAEEK